MENKIVFFQHKRRNRKDFRNLLFFIVFCLFHLTGVSQVSIYSEDFSTNDGKGQNQTTYDVSGVTTWSIVKTGCTFSTNDYAYVNSNRFELKGSFGATTKLSATNVLEWYANAGAAIDISSYRYVEVSVTLGNASTFSDGQLAQISFDGTSYIDIGYFTGTSTSTSYTVSNITGTNLYFRILGWTANSASSSYFDDVLITGYSGNTTESITSGSGTWNVPAGVTTLGVYGWGGGGGGGTNNSGSNGGGGGGGGGFAFSSITVTPSATCYYSIGAAGIAGEASPYTVAGAGGDTWFNASANEAPSSSTDGILAKGGALGGPSLGSGGAGGSAASCVGTITKTGGTGGNPGSMGGGGGGASATIVGLNRLNVTTSTNGAAGNGSSNGAGGTVGALAGDGGNGSSSDGTAGLPGLQPGGGGGGSSDASAATDDGGAGGAGKLIFVYYVPVYTWDGSTDGDWKTAANWSENAVPGSGSTVVIPTSASYTNAPNVDEADALAGSLTIESGGTLTIASGKLTVTSIVLESGGTINISGGELESSGKFDWDGELTISAGTLDVDNEIELSATMTETISSGTIECSGEWDGASDDGGFTPSGGTVVMDGASSSNIGIHASANFYNLTIDRSGQVVTATSNIAVSGELSIDNGTYALGTTTTSVTGLTDVNATVTISTGSIDSNGELDATGGTITATDAATFYFSGTTVTSFGTFNYSTSTVVLDGDNQTIPAGTFHNLTCGGSAGTKTLGGDVIVRNTLDFSVDNSLIVTGAFTLTIGIEGSANGDITNYSNVRYVKAYDNAGTIGYLKRFVNLKAPTAYVFPIADATGYIPITVTINAGSTLSNAYIITYTKPAIVTGLNTSGLTTYLSRFWEVSQSGITSPDYDINLTYLTADITGGGAETSLLPYKESGGTWYKPTEGSFTDGTTQGSGSVDDVNNILSWTGLSSFSFFGGVINAAAPLPVNLLSFDARELNNKVQIDWVTASETNNDYFTIQRSAEGEIFEDVLIEKGAGNSNDVLYYSVTDQTPLPGLSYYRLKQTDFDGKYSYSDLTAVTLNNVSAIKQVVFFPNPITNNTFTVNFTSSQIDNVELYIYNSIGAQVDYKQIEVTKGDNTLKVDMQNNTKGLYIISLINKGISVKSNVIKL